MIECRMTAVYNSDKILRTTSVPLIFTVEFYSDLLCTYCRQIQFTIRCTNTYSYFQKKVITLMFKYF